MPVKKTTKKPTTRRTASKTITKTASVASSKPTCNTDMCGISMNTVTLILLIVNTVLLLFVASNFTINRALQNMEIQRVGGIENYETIQKIYELDAFKEQQRFQIEQTYQALQGMMWDQPMFLPEQMIEEDGEFEFILE